MKAITVASPGDPESLQLTDVPTPDVGPHEVLIRVAAAGVNRGDVLQRQGHYPPPAGASEIIGLEVSGWIEAVGDDVDEWQPGQECVALLAGGGYAELVCVPAGQVVPPPPGVDLVTSAGVIEVAATVTSNLGELLTEGACVLIHGGAGGIGTFATQYAKARGARVVCTAGSPEKLHHCREHGADLALDYHHDWVAGLKEFSPAGADVILDILGAKYLGLNVKALANDGTLVVIGLQGGTKGELNLGALISKRGTVRATTLRARPVEQKSAICARVAQEVWPMFSAGQIKPAPTQVFALNEVAQAHRHLESGDHVGKLVLALGDRDH